MKKIILSTSLLLLSTIGYGADQPEAVYGVETTNSEYFDDIYLYNNLVHYLDNKNLHITYQAETVGEFNQPDQMIFSVDGNSFRWNKYYIDGFRVDSRFAAGSSLYKTNMSNYNLGLDYLNSELRFDTSANRRERIEASYNFGGVGGISIGAEDFIRLLHPSAPDRAYKPIDLRSQIKGSGTADVNFVIRGERGEYMQNIYLNFGQRSLVGFDHTGINGTYPENYGTLQIGGATPIKFGGLFDQTNYMASYSQRDHYGAEFYLSEQESAELSSYAVSLYGSKQSGDLSYTSGFNFALNHTEHEDLNYSRNVVDHDGEAFEPWSPDGSTIEFSHSLTLKKELNGWLDLNFDGYNTLLRFNPSQSNFQNTTYSQLTLDESPTMLYLYEWESRGFYSGLLENSLGLSTHREIGSNLDFRANLDLTLDAMLVSGSSRLSPNFELRAGFDYHPFKWLGIELNLGRERVNYNIEDIKFLSNDYLSGNVYYINDSGEKGGLFTTTGGKYHTLSSDAKQPTYYVVDIPITLSFGRHTISALQSYRKYQNMWSVGFEGDYSDYGSMQNTQISWLTDSDEIMTQDLDIFYFDGGKEVNYEVGSYPDGIMGDNFFTSSPFYFCSNVEYSYVAPKFTISVGWQSYMMSGLSTLGNGPLHNNIGALSESSANPNTYSVITNLDSDYAAVGRLDQDRAYIARIFASFNITPKLTMAMNAKFKDGQPFSSYQVEIKSDAQGNQAAILPDSSRGINTADGDFGKREDGVYMVDLRMKYEATIAKRRCEFGLFCYNSYDFGNELTEYIFDQDIGNNRNAMSLTIPRGFIFSFNMDL